METDDLTNKMFRAINGMPPLLPREVSSQEKIDTLIKFINDVSISVKKRIGRLIVMQECSKALSTCTEGIAVNLNELPGPLLSQIYELVVCVISSNAETPDHDDPL